MSIVLIVFLMVGSYIKRKPSVADCLLGLIYQLSEKLVLLFELPFPLRTVLVPPLILKANISTSSAEETQPVVIKRERASTAISVIVISCLFISETLCFDIANESFLWNTIRLTGVSAGSLECAI